MTTLAKLVESIEACSACELMKENRSIGIPYVHIKSKPNAQFMFVGRDPSPRTATKVGERGGKSVFINEIFKIIDNAGVSDDRIYITDLCKCHWRTSAGKPLPKTENRPAKLNVSIAQTCMNQWLIQEIEILKPRLVVAFGEEVYQLLRPFTTKPCPAPTKLSAKKDKSVLDAEFWFVKNGPLSLDLGDNGVPFAFLRHAGNSNRLPRSTKSDKRMHFYQESTQRVIQLLRENNS